MLPGITPALMMADARPIGYQVARSLRFNPADTPWLTRTPATTGDQRVFTISFWTKKALLGASPQWLFHSYYTASNAVTMYWNHSGTVDALGLQIINSGTKLDRITTAVFRDPNAWMHICWSVDTRPATPVMTLEINGIAITSFSPNTFSMVQNEAMPINAPTAPFWFGRYGGSSANYFGGYLAEMNYIDGAAQPASAFGQFNSTTGQWEPIVYTGSYGVNGSYLKFADNTNLPDTAGLFHLNNSGANSSASSSLAATLNGTISYDAVNKKFGSHSVSAAGAGGVYMIDPKLNFPASTPWSLDFWHKGTATPNITANWTITFSPFYVLGNLFYSSSSGSSWNVVAGAANGWTANPSAFSHYYIDVDGAGSIRFYQDGVLTGTVTWNYLTHNNWAIGGQAGAWSLNGNLDEIRFSNKRRWTANFTPPTAPATDTRGVGADSSGNENNWLPANFVFAAGVGNDSLRDTPTNGGVDTGVGGECTGNYPTWNPLNISGGGTVVLLNGNLDAAWNASRTVVATMALPTSGVWYFEHGGSVQGGGICTAQANIGNYLGSDAFGWIYNSDGNKYTAGSGVAFGPAYGASDIIGVAFNAATGALSFYKNGVSVGTAFTVSPTGGPYFFAIGGGNLAGGGVASNFGQRPWAFPAAAIAAGAKALCTQNLPDPAIAIPAKYFDISTWTGTALARFLINSYPFQPDILWIKARNSTLSHGVHDAVRGNTKLLESNSTAIDRTTADEVLSFNSNGFSLGMSTAGYTNFNGTTYVGWQWQKGIVPGLFIGAFASASGTQAVPHGLGVAPKFVLVKNSTGSAAGWHVWHSALANPSTSYLLLNSTSAALTFSTMWGPSGHDSVNLNFTVSGSIFPGNTNITYAFAEVPGFSRFGSYVGNGAADGSFVWCGFRPKFVLMKCATAASSWQIVDATRSPYNVSNITLYPESASGEDLAASVDFLSNGFKVRNTTGTNASGQTMIFAAFAESPFKYARAR